MALARSRSEDIRCCLVLHRRSHSCPLQAGTTTVHEGLGSDNFRSLSTSYRKVCRPHFSEYVIRDICSANTDLDLIASSLSYQPCKFYEDDWDILNDFPNLTLQSQTEFFEQRLTRIKRQTGDNVSKPHENLSLEHNSITFLHNPSHELTLVNGVPRTTSSDLYVTVDNDQTSSFNSIHSPTSDQLLSFINTVQPCTTYSQVDESHRFDSSCFDSVLSRICIHRSSCSSEAFSFSPLYETQLLFDENQPNNDRLGGLSDKRTTSNQRTILFQLPILFELILFYAAEESLISSSGDEAKWTKPASWDFDDILMACNQPVFTFHNMRCLSSITDSLTSFPRYDDYVTRNSIELSDKSAQTMDIWHEFMTNRVSSSVSLDSPCVSSLFLQNSASDKNTKRESSESSPILLQASSPIPMYQATDNRSLSSVPVEFINQNQLPVQVSEHVASSGGTQETILNLPEARFSSISHLSPQLQLLPIEEGNRPSMLSVCGVEMGIEEVRMLDDIPAEFATAEVLFRRAVRSESVKADRLSQFLSSTSSLLKHASSLDQLNKRLSAIIPSLHRADESYVELRIPRTKTSIELEPGQLVAPNPLPRSSLVVVRPSHLHTVQNATHQSDDEVSVSEVPELNSKLTAISWVTMDSTEISRAMNLIRHVETASSEALDTVPIKGSIKPCTVSAKEYQLHIGHMKQGGLSVDSHLDNTLITISRHNHFTPNLHHCDVGRVNEETAHRRTASPDSSRFINLMKKFANARIRAKSERFVLNNTGYHLSDLYNSITKH
ncbi:hypothetical protein FBUS_09492 [Fasciolopsis buskii]|uniref:Uncharacterized protein n=1 Tax=Fasciolopsis buskii TaxID=27845 RepID=A0A8E0S2F9_9TREM|nr:hypothetical protein FBUS_09492 [Fasciolopsis buski]